MQSFFWFLASLQKKRVNLFEKYPEKVKEMNRLITVYKDQGYLLKDK